jgi:hypothetical protein
MMHKLKRLSPISPVTLSLHRGGSVQRSSASTLTGIRGERNRHSPKLCTTTLGHKRRSRHFGDTSSFFSVQSALLSNQRARSLSLSSDTRSIGRGAGAVSQPWVRDTSTSGILVLSLVCSLKLSSRALSLSRDTRSIWGVYVAVALMGFVTITQAARHAASQASRTAQGEQLCIP